MQELDITHKAEFNPNIKQYIFIAGFFLLLVTIIGIPLIPIWILGYGFYFSNRYYKNLECKLTSKHLIYKKGVLHKVSKTIPLENIQDITYIENPILRLFGLMILKIETAGQSNPQSTDMKLIGIVNTEDFKDKIFNQRDLLLENNRRGYANPEVKSDTDNALLLTEIRDLLKDIRDRWFRDNQPIG